MHILHAIAGTIALASALASGKKVAPNVLVLLTDDQGWGDVDYNCYNDTEYCASMFTNTPLFFFFPLARTVFCCCSQPRQLAARICMAHCSAWGAVHV